MKVSVVTPTADRPVGLALAEKFMHRQRRQPDEWIVADGGAMPARCTAGQVHVHDPRLGGAANFANNLLNGIARATGDVVLVVEDDDHYSSYHVETFVDALERAPHALLAGRHEQPYYHVGTRSWRLMRNNGTHSSLCQTAMRREALPLFEQTIRACLARSSYGIDTNLWRATPRDRWALTGQMTVLGIKGLPGQAGLGIGHRPNGSGWTPDPDLAQLRTWLGDDAALYAEYRT